MPTQTIPALDKIDERVRETTRPVILINLNSILITPTTINSYTILAPQREGKFVDAKQSTAAVLTTIQLDENDYRLGHTKARKSSNPIFR